MRRDCVVVLNYNRWDDTDRCVRSLLEGSPEAEIIVVDNGSTDGFPADTATRWPRVSTQRNETNLGFSGGMNSGIRAALERGVDTVTVLNNDTVVSPGVIKALGDVAQRGIAASPEVRYLDRPLEVWFGGGQIDPLTNLPHHVATELLPLADAEGLRRTSILAGCCITATAETWQRVGLFDDRYFLNFEDADWSVRAGEAGVELVVNTKATIKHAVSASFTGAYSYLGLYYYARNGLLFGRERCPSAFPQNVRFLRRHVLPHVVRRGGESDHRETARRAYVLGVAVRDVLIRRLGPAPSHLARRAVRWTSDT